MEGGDPVKPERWQILITVDGAGAATCWSSEDEKFRCTD